MQVIIKETGERKSLTAIDPLSSTEWTMDLVGNTGAFEDGRFMWDNDKDVYIVSQAEYGWWADYIEGIEEVYMQVGDLVDALYHLDSPEDGLSWMQYIRDRVELAMSEVEMDDEPAAGLAEIAVIRAEFDLKDK